MTALNSTLAGRGLLSDGFSGHFSGWYGAFVAARRRAAFRETLAQMGDRELLDIGVAEDELARVHAREVFTPRAWAKRGVRLD